ncbi:unnamed protein product [Ostreobium quekettii]|uniref:Protein kinase domain-containing protein n=1 Tax=Ostreobium quekettii TaxID=121088 RepID=A0A8S1JCZ4_9CHLO|nr:unnamed protein product [Ostreobium quekettii]
MVTIGQHFYPGDDAAHCNPDRCWRYNNRSLAFLEQQLQKTASVQKFQHVLREAKGALMGTRQRLCYERLAKAMQIRRSLIQHHTRAFNVKKFFTPSEAQCGVEEICGAIREFLEMFSLHASGLEGRVPQTDIDDDKRTLGEYLGYVLGLCTCSFEGVSAVVKEEWKRSRQEYNLQMKRFQTIADDEVDKGQDISRVLCKCRWRGREFAFKQFSEDNERNTVQLAQTFGEAACMDLCHSSPFVVGLLRVTNSGSLLMELGEADLVTWLKRNQPADVKLKLQFLLQAGSGLADVHCEEFVHCNVKPEKFVVFSGGDVKISVLNSMVASTHATCTITLEDSDAVWVAPEILHGLPHTCNSDIYSFGVVMYAIMAETQPYGRNCTAAVVLDKKVDEQPPCDLPCTLPANLVKLMSECCSADPAKRPPSMDAVCTRLQSILEDLTISGSTLNLKNMALKEAQALGEPEYELPGAKYNKEIVGFLNQQVQKYHEMSIPTSPKEDILLAGEVALETGERLIEKHKKRVDIKTFYQSFEARDIVEDVCERIFQVVRHLGKEPEVTVEVKVPRAAYDRDRHRMSMLLKYVLQGEEPKGDFDIPQDWKASRQEHEQRIHDLPPTDEIVTEDLHKVGTGSFSKVSSVVWSGRLVAVKEIVGKDGIEDIENRAESFKDILYQIPLDEEHVAKVYAISKSGQLLVCPACDRVPLAMDLGWLTVAVSLAQSGQYHTKSGIVCSSSPSCAVGCVPVPGNELSGSSIDPILPNFEFGFLSHLHSASPSAESLPHQLSYVALSAIGCPAANRTVFLIEEIRKKKLNLLGSDSG